MKSVFILVLALSGATFAFAQTELAPIATKIGAQALSLPVETPLVSLTPGDKDHPRGSYALKRTFAADGSFTIDWASARYRSSQTFRPDGTLLAGKETDLTKNISVETQSDAARTSVRTIVTEKGAVKSDKKSPLKPGIVLREELQNLNLQAWTYGIRDGLKLQSLSPDGGLVGDFQILFKQTAEPLKLSDKYTYPAEFKALFTGQNAARNYVVADMSLQGIASFFFPHHFYLVYVPTPAGLQFVAYFGEDPKDPVFQYVPKV